MIVCTINGKVGYPSSSEKIKITFENQYVKDSGSYTYDISFPMKIHENRVLFSNVNRFDVKKELQDFEDCKLYAGNRLVISGKGTVTSINNDVVKLQIVGGKSRIKFNSKFENHYIDEIDYPVVTITKGIDREGYSQLGKTQVVLDESVLVVMADLTDWNFVGQPGIAVFNPINDESNEDVIRNNIVALKIDSMKINGISYPKGNRVLLYNLAVQPNLMYVLKKVLEFEGYTITKNDFDVEPWNRLYIASALQSVRIKDALPHWTVYTFIEEIRKFFNASIVFDDIEKTVKIISANELLTNETVGYDCLDEFSSEYEDEGLSNLATSNIEYSFDDSANRSWKEVLSQAVQKRFTTKTFESIYTMVPAAEAMSSRERRCTIFKVGYDYYVWAMLPADGNPDNENLKESRTLCGFFNPIIRDIESEDSVGLKICPVAIHQRKKHKNGSSIFQRVMDNFPNTWIYIPSVTNFKQSSLDDMAVDENGDYYISVQDAIEGDAGDTATEEVEDERALPVMFQGNEVVSLELQKTTPYNLKVSSGENTRFRFPITYTDYRMNRTFSGEKERASLTLDAIPHKGVDNLRKNTDIVTIDKHNLIAINFMTNDIPDPTKIYAFRNKRYICQKIELELNNGVVSEQKKGYFYEIL